MWGFGILPGCGLGGLDTHLPGVLSQNRHSLGRDLRVICPLWGSVALSVQLPDGETSVGKLLLGPGDSLLRLWGWVTWALRLSQPQAWSLIS